jgi:hypothetical protein
MKVFWDNRKLETIKNEIWFRTESMHEEMFNSMQQSPLKEADSCPEWQKLPTIYTFIAVTITVFWDVTPRCLVYHIVTS